MKANLGIFILAAMMALAGRTRAQSSGTNEAPSLPMTAVQPLIEMNDVPLSLAIDTLARQAEVNYLLDPALFTKVDAGGKVIKDLPVTFRLENVRAKDVLTRLLSLHHLVLIEDPVSNIAIITRTGQSTKPTVCGRIRGGGKVPKVYTNVGYTNVVIPLIQFSEVPVRPPSRIWPGRRVSTICWNTR